jgi:hypothetical protein
VFSLHTTIDLTIIKLPQNKNTSAAVNPPQIHRIEKIALVLGAFLLYLAAFRINQTLDEHVLYAQGVALVFLPAGVKHIAILIGRLSGAIGCFLALAYVTPEFWTDISLSHTFLYSGISTAATVALVLAGMQILNIHNDLSNLRLMHLPLIDLITTTGHSFVTNAYFIADGMKVNEEFISNALGMAFGDFTGSFVMMMMLLGAIKIKQYFQTRE